MRMLKKGEWLVEKWHMWTSVVTENNMYIHVFNGSFPLSELLQTSKRASNLIL